MKKVVILVLLFLSSFAEASNVLKMKAKMQLQKCDGEMKSCPLSDSFTNELVFDLNKGCEKVDDKEICKAGSTTLTFHMESVSATAILAVYKTINKDQTEVQLTAFFFPAMQFTSQSVLSLSFPATGSLPSKVRLQAASYYDESTKSFFVPTLELE